MLGIDEDLEAVLAGIAGARDHELGVAPVERGIVHEAEFGARRGTMASITAAASGPLQRQQCAVVRAVAAWPLPRQAVRDAAGNLPPWCRR